MAVTLSFYNKFMEFVGDGGIDLDDDTFKVELYNGSHAFAGANENRAAISANALGTAFGYTSPGKDLVSVTWVSATAVQTWDAGDNTWTAGGGSIGPAEHAVIYSDTSTVPTADLLMCNIAFGQAETAGDGTDFKITFDGSGLFTIS